MDGAADSPTKGEILDQINEHGFMSYPRTETRSSRETSRTVPLVRLYSRSLPPPPFLFVRQATISLFRPCPSPLRLDFVIPSHVGKGEEKEGEGRRGGEKEGN